MFRSLDRWQCLNLIVEKCDISRRDLLDRERLLVGRVEAGLLWLPVEFLDLRVYFSVTSTFIERALLGDELFDGQRLIRLWACIELPALSSV